jgi:hypothetical protein
MAEFMTFRRWTINDASREAELVALVREAIVPTYRKLPGCLHIGLLRIIGTNDYLATQHWVSKAKYEEVVASLDYVKWREAYEPDLMRWHELMTFADEWETEDKLAT